MHRWRAHSIEPLVHRSKSSCFSVGCSSPHQPIWIKPFLGWFLMIPPIQFPPFLTGFHLPMVAVIQTEKLLLLEPQTGAKGHCHEFLSNQPDLYMYILSVSIYIYIVYIYINIYIYMVVSQTCVWNVLRCSGRVEQRSFVTGLVPDLPSVMKYRLCTYTILKIYKYISQRYTCLSYSRQLQLFFTSSARHPCTPVTTGSQCHPLATMWSCPLSFSPVTQL